jgi:hypothetical protein
LIAVGTHYDEWRKWRQSISTVCGARDTPSHEKKWTYAENCKLICRNIEFRFSGYENFQGDFMRWVKNVGEGGSVNIEHIKEAIEND